jgi:hypothetical protein
MASINYKVAGFSPNVKNDLGVIQRNDFRRDGAYSKDGVTPSRFSYNFDGVDDYGVLATRAINPDSDIDIEFRTGPIVPAAGGVERTVVSQCLTATFASKEFSLYFNSSTGALQPLVGGSFLASATQATLAPNTRYRYTLIGNTQTFFVNGAQVRQDTVTRGAAREPTAQTVLMAQTHGSPTTFRAFGSGIFYDIRINGVLWQMATRNSATQVSSPAGNTMTLVNTTSDRWQEIIE